MCSSKACRPTCMYLAFMLSASAAVMCGFDAAFNVYAEALKDTFNFTQTEVELVASMGTLGLVLTFLETFISNAFGYTVMCCLIMIAVPGFSALFALVTFYREELSFHLGLVCGIQLILSTGDCMAYVVITRTCVEYLPKKHSGKIVGSFMVCISCGKMVFGGIMGFLFPDNLFAFFLILCILTFVIFGGCFLCLYVLLKKPLKYKSDIKADDEVSELLKYTEDEDKSVKDLLRSPTFHAIFWTSVSVNACGYTSLNNITVIADSVGIAHYMNYVYIISIVIIIIRLTFGVLFDKFNSELCGFALLLVNNAGFITAMLIGIFALDSSNMMPTTVFFGIGYACSMSIPLCICIRLFGRTSYSPVLSAFYSMTGISQVLLQIFLGYFYDRKIVETSLEKTCYGKQCFFWSFITMLFIAILASLIQLITCYVSYRDKRKK